jgi:methylmalonyl-CoA carboxyltransferase 5S subunit
LLRPEWNQLRADALALNGCNGSDEDVLTYAMFPQVAPKFFPARSQGPKNLSKEPAKAPAKPAAKPASAPAQGQLTEPVSYVVTLNGKSHNVTVAPVQ